MCEKTLKELFNDTYFLFLKTLNYHWNVTSVSFMELHLLFERQYNELLEATDLIAEHMRTFKITVDSVSPQTSNLTPINPSLYDKEMIKDLLAGHEKISAFLNKEAPLIKDIATNDLMIERCRAHDKTAWMLRSYL